MGQRELQFSIHAAIREAASRHHEYVTPEHLLYALLFEDQARHIIGHCGGDLDSLRQELEGHLAQTPALSPGDDPVDPKQSLGFRRVLERAILHVRSSGKGEVDSGDVLVAFYSEKESYARHLLERQGITRLDLVQYITNEHDEPGRGHPEELAEGAGEGEAAHRQPLQKYAAHLTQMARDGQLDPLIGRKNELRRVMQVLCRRTKNNPVLVGEAGVGKTVLVEGLAQLIVADQVPERLQGSEIYRLDLGSLLAGTKFRGQFEERMKATLDALQEEDKAILFIDEMHMIAGAGSTTGGSMDASNLLKPILQEGRVRCIGATTHEDFRRHLEKDRALVRRLQKVEIPETTIEDTVQILEGLRGHYEAFHGVQYTQEALRAATELSQRYVTERHLPDKAIDVIDEAGARNHLLLPQERRAILDASQMEEVVASIARIPDLSAQHSERERLRVLHERMKAVVFGQDEAIDALVAAVKLSRAGLGPPQQPVGSFLFVGPTGVGKTEVARQLANVLGIGFKRFDMSEYMEKHAVSRLIGAPPGYVGYDQGGLLTEAIRKTPHSVLLLDEIEKAHPDLFDILLQVMDHATLTDNNGREADFRNVILCMTSNAGARRLSEKGIGFGSSAGSVSNGLREVERMFSPEFRNRLTRTISFQRLSPPVVERIVHKFIGELRDQLSASDVLLQMTPAAVTWLAGEGYDEVFGARPLKRLIERTIRQPLADELLFGRLEGGGVVEVDLKDGALAFNIQST